MSLAAGAQGFPAPGTGPLSWERVGDQALELIGFDIRPGGMVFGKRGLRTYRLTLDTSGLPAGTWEEIQSGGGHNAVLIVGGDTLLSGSSGSMSRSLDAGDTWEYVNADPGSNASLGPGYPDGFFAPPPGHPYAGRLFAGDRFWTSDDRGATWTQGDHSAYPADIAGFTFAEVSAFVALPSGRVVHGRLWASAAPTTAG